MSDKFDFKSTGAIVAPLYDDIAVVKSIIKEMDEEEYTRYYPEGLVTADAGPFRVMTTYIGKFEIDLRELYRRCAKVGIVIRAVQEHRVTTSLSIGGEE